MGVQRDREDEPESGFANGLLRDATREHVDPLETVSGYHSSA